VSLLSDLDASSLQLLSAEVARVRHVNGSIPKGNLAEIGIHDWKRGPLTNLVWFTAKDWIIVGVWASYGLGRQDRLKIESVAGQIVDSQGIPAAATWALRCRPNGALDLDFLSSQLTDAWKEASGQIRNGDIIKSFRKWVR
jgi:hypothetical protein